MRALVARPRRKAHLATLVDGAWVTLCDRDLPVEGTAAQRHDWATEIGDAVLAGLCAHCRTPLLVAGLVAVEVAPALVAEVRALRTQVDGILGEIERRGRETLALQAAAETEVERAWLAVAR